MTSAAVVLCGGESRRMGTDKALIEWEGVPLYRYVAGRLAEGFDPVLLAPGRPGRLGPTPFEEVADDPPNAGPLGGICAALAAIPDVPMAVVAVDMPYCDPDLLKRMAALLKDHDAVVPEVEGRLQPLHAVYAPTSLSQLARSARSGDRSVLAACKRLSVKVISGNELTELGGKPSLATNMNLLGDLYDSQRTRSRLADEHRD